MKMKGKTVPVHEKLVIKILHDISSGLRACHDRGVVHLDMKTENVLIDASMAIKIADFGIALLLAKGEECRKCGRKISGTKGWMAPELAQRILTRKSDVYGCGLVMFHVCTIVQRAGKTKPFHTQEWDKYKDLHLTDNFNLDDFPITHNYRQDLKDLIAQMLDPDWTKRPSAADILDRIEDWPRFKNNFETAESVFTGLDNFKGIKIRTSSTNNTGHSNTFGTFTK
jgi:serine/threonine protein kinase